jgi:hypothetical protein
MVVWRGKIWVGVTDMEFMRRDSDQIGSRICDMEELRILYENEIAIGIGDCILPYFISFVEQYSS